MNPRLLEVDMANSSMRSAKESSSQRPCDTGMTERQGDSRSAWSVIATPSNSMDIRIRTDFCRIEQRSGVGDEALGVVLLFNTGERADACGVMLSGRASEGSYGQPPESLG